MEDRYKYHPWIEIHKNAVKEQLQILAKFSYCWSCEPQTFPQKGLFHYQERERSISTRLKLCFCFNPRALKIIEKETSFFSVLFSVVFSVMCLYHTSEKQCHMSYYRSQSIISFAVNKTARARYNAVELCHNMCFFHSLP